jgi:hypothetical protein
METAGKESNGMHPPVNEINCKWYNTYHKDKCGNSLPDADFNKASHEFQIYKYLGCHYFYKSGNKGASRGIFY